MMLLSSVFLMEQFRSASEGKIAFTLTNLHGFFFILLLLFAFHV